MSDFKTQWSKVEFKTYLLLYCANADYVETEEEKELITSRVNKDILKNIHKEFDKDNDYQRIQKIIHTANSFGYTHKEADVLLDKMKELFFPEGHDMGTLEENMFRGLKHLLS
jgi:hypothetical protein